MNIVFTHGYFLKDDPKELEIMRPYPPLGILYLSAWLDKNGFANDVFDTTFSDKSTQKDFLLKQKPKIIAIYTNLMTKINVIELLQWIKKETSLQKSVVVIGGPDVTHNIHGYIEAGGDVIVIGEGEQTFLEITQTISNGITENFGHINGVAFKDNSGEIIKTATRMKIAQIDDLPFPNRHKIDLQKYLDTWKQKHGQSTVSLSTQRGCPYTCKWCSTAVYGQSYRRRSPANVVDEIIELQRNNQFDLIWFVDDVFTVSHKWLSNFQEELSSRNVKVAFECITRADRLTPEVINTLKACGCFRVWIGAESGSQKIINAMDRRVNVKHVQDMIIEARQQGIEAGTFIMLGYPGEIEEDIFETLNHLKRANPDLFTITIAYPIKGTGLYEEIADIRTTTPDWMQSTDRDIDFKRTYQRRYYDYAVRWMVNSIHLHKKQLQSKHISTSGLKLWFKIYLLRIAMHLSR